MAHGTAYDPYSISTSPILASLTTPEIGCPRGPTELSVLEFGPGTGPDITYPDMPYTLRLQRSK